MSYGVGRVPVVWSWSSRMEVAAESTVGASLRPLMVTVNVLEVAPPAPSLE